MRKVLLVMMFLVGCSNHVYPKPYDYFGTPIQPNDIIIVSAADRNDLYVDEYLVLEVTPTNELIVFDFRTQLSFQLYRNQVDYSKQVIVRYHDCSINYEQNKLVCIEG